MLADKNGHTLLFLLFKGHVEMLDTAMKRMQLGLLIGCEGERRAIPHKVLDIAVVVEETIVLQGCCTQLCYANGCHLLCQFEISRRHEVFF